MVIVTLEHKKQRCIGLDIEDREHRAFLTMQEAEKWLEDNNFYYGQRDFFNYTPDDAKEWCHKNDASWEYINVEIETVEDRNSPSCYKEFDPGMSPWQKAAFEDGRREGFVEMLVEMGLPTELIIEKYMKNFKENEEDAKYWISLYENNKNESALAKETT